MQTAKKRTKSSSFFNTAIYAKGEQKDRNNFFFQMNTPYKGEREAQYLMAQ